MMKQLVVACAMAGLLLWGASQAQADEETVTLKVDMGGCASCVWIVTGVLEGVEGVTAVDVSARDETAVVRFDNAKTTVGALVEATSSYGFPTAVMAQDQAS